MTSKADQKRTAAYSRASVRRKMVEMIGFDTILYRIDEDDEKTEFSLPHPMMYDAATRKALKPIKDEDTEGIVKVLLGDEQWARFEELGGDPEELGELITLVQVESQRAVREGTPLTR